MTDDNNASVEQQTSETDEELYNKDFGAPLKDAREKSGMTIAEVAKQLLIPQDIIVAIENSKVADLPSATFTVGYIRSYSRILNITADEIISSYNRLIPKAVSPVSSSPFVPAEKRESNNTTVVIMIVSILSLLLLAWWFQLGSVSDSNQAQFLDEMPGFNDPNNTQENTTRNDEELMLPDQSSSDGASIEILEEVDKSAEDEKKTIEIESDPLVATDELILTASGDSWCEVFGADGERLFYRLLNQGEEKKIMGKAPFDVFLGDASQVRIETNKKIVSFDHLISSNKNTVNFRISSDGIAIRSGNR